MIITIDGPAAAGKGTLSKALAEKYEYAYFDTGMIYRAVGLQMLLNGNDLTDSAAAEKLASDLTFAEMNKLSQHPDFRSAKGGNAASMVSAYPEVREALLKMQRDFALNPVFADGAPAKGVIYDGRDTGTVVCPSAEIKFFVTASPEVRAERRYREFLEKGQPADYEKVLEDVKARDARDAGRASAPMKPADDAVIFDTSDLSVEEVFAKACRIIEEKV
mgnify:CR=1 FL=1